MLQSIFDHIENTFLIGFDSVGKTVKKSLRFNKQTEGGRPSIHKQDFHARVQAQSGYLLARACLPCAL
jgi:hypothetical protein